MATIIISPYFGLIGLDKSFEPACRFMIETCFDRVSLKLGRRDAWALFDEITRSRKPRRKKGVHDKDYNERLVSLWDCYPTGKKRDEAIKALCVKYKRNCTIESARRQGDRLFKLRERSRAKIPGSKQVDQKSAEHAQKTMDGLMSGIMECLLKTGG
jgi:hypothetical protein